MPNNTMPSHGIRKPTALKRLHGDREDRIPIGEPEPDGPVLKPDLSPAASIEWDRLAPELLRTEVLTCWDVDTLAAYCEWAVIQKAAAAEVAAEGHTIYTDNGPRPHPSLNALEKASQMVMRLGGKLGLNPSDRGKLGRTPKELKKAGTTDARNPERLLS